MLDDDEDRWLLSAELTLIYMFLFLFALYEIFFLTYLVPNNYRPSFWAELEMDELNVKNLIRSKTILVQDLLMVRHTPTD